MDGPLLASHSAKLHLFSTTLPCLHNQYYLGESYTAKFSPQLQITYAVLEAIKGSDKRKTAQGNGTEDIKVILKIMNNNNLCKELLPVLKNDSSDAKHQSLKTGERINE
ncbi:hypothetical protein STEG23_008298, partial [Scotinomys teguina]